MEYTLIVEDGKLYYDTGKSGKTFVGDIEAIYKEYDEEKQWKMIADKRKELLRRVDSNTALCPICGFVTAEIIEGNHADDCDLAKELRD
jgi:hypothetical protein